MDEERKQKVKQDRKQKEKIQQVKTWRDVICATKRMGYAIKSSDGKEFR